jgi:hypothetical protein
MTDAVTRGRPARVYRDGNISLTRAPHSASCNRLAGQLRVNGPKLTIDGPTLSALHNL